jgi:hypothetical protein
MSHSLRQHIQQIYTGFFMLSQQGTIDLRQIILRRTGGDFTHSNRVQSCLQVVLNDEIKLFYDAQDSWEIDEEYLHQADYYFKRSYAPSRLEFLGEQKNKIYPLGNTFAKIS